MAQPFAFAQDESATPNQPPGHEAPWPVLSGGENRAERNESLAAGPELERGLSVAEMLEQRRRLDGALGQIQPQRPGIVDAYVLTIALDSDPVFAREAREAERVLSRRYGAEGRSVALAGPDGRQDDLPRGSISALVFALARIAEQMDTNEDVLVLYSTSHGLPQGLAYHYGDTGYGILSPERFQAILEELGIERRILLISACYSGVFIPALASNSTAILTASTGNRTSFGCEAENDWTFFGDALINRALRKPQSLEEASKEASLAIAGWELRARAPASLPQTVIGNDVSDWIDTLDENIPAVAGEPVGRPAAGE